MKRMVKNGDLIDVEPDGSITVAGKPIGGGGGGDYTAGSNIEISESKQISLKSALTKVNSIDFSQTDGVSVTGEGRGGLEIKTKWSGRIFPAIWLASRDATSTKGTIILNFNANNDYDQSIYFDCLDYNGKTAYGFTTRGSKVPQVPSGNGTYILKASVSGDAVTYTWVAE